MPVIVRVEVPIAQSIQSSRFEPDTSVAAFKAALFPKLAAKTSFELDPNNFKLYLDPE